MDTFNTCHNFDEQGQM